MATGKQIKHYRQKLGWTLERLEEVSGVATGSLFALEKRDSERSKFFQAIAAAFGLTVEQLSDEKNDWPVVDGRLNPTLAAQLPESAPSTKPTPGSRVREITTPDDSNAVQVPLLENSGSMGEGSAMLDGDVLAGQLTLNPIWVSSTLHPSRQDALRFIHGYGDSMTPTFNSGDVLLVDTGINEVKIDGVYVLTAHDRLFIKRVRQRMDGVFEISSDNPTHKTVDVLNGNHDVLVLGRVIWVWNGRRT